MTGISRSRVSEPCEKSDGRARTLPAHPVEGDRRYPGTDAFCVEARQIGRLVPVAVTIAVAVDTGVRR